MNNRSSIQRVTEIMLGFADRTGLTSGGNYPVRYLWTDSFAVCNFLELYRQTGNEKFKQLALDLVDQVHYTLGRHRDDDFRTGWISGLSEDEGEKHPTLGGLRIGKKKNERKPDDLFDQRLEWDRDGQYYHYLTKWMHALSRVTQVTGDDKYNIWALELAQTANRGFTYFSPYGSKRQMYWKMSIDLSYPLVSSMGHHDPLDGFITCIQLQAVKLAFKSKGPDLESEISQLAAICKGKDWSTDDPLGLGGLLSDAYKVGQLLVYSDFKHEDLLIRLLKDCLRGLTLYTGQNHLLLPANYRLAFRELGLCIGLHSIEKLKELIRDYQNRFLTGHPIYSRIESPARYAGLTDIIEKFWLNERNRTAETWKEHMDINLVMLATSLAPWGYLIISDRF
jgi:hypothetical protein